MHWKSVWILIVLAAPVSATAQPEATENRSGENAHVWKPDIRSVAVFKNGLGFFMREGAAVARDGWVLAEQVPPAKFGTLAVYSTDPQQVVDVVGSGPGEVVEFDDRDAPNTVEAKRARLLAARQLQLELTYEQHGSVRKAAGKLVAVSPDFAILESQSNSFAVPIAEITRFQVLDLPLRVHVAADGDEAVDQVRLGMAYLREGITWIPEYSLKILDDRTAELTLRGTLINEAEDLIHCDVNFVVGVPHFVHTEYLAPLAVGQVIRTIGTAVAPSGVQTQIMSRALIANSITSNGFTSDQFDGPGVVQRPVPPQEGQLAKKLGNLPRLEGPAASDYTVYTKEDLTVRRGERAIVTLFVKKIRYGHIYRWSPPALMEHSLVLHNETGSAWTTGPCLAVTDRRPLSEDLLRYTPQGGKAEIPVSAAVNIAHEQFEMETGRKLKAHSPRPDVFLDLVTVSGELGLKNFEETAVDIVVVVTVPGKPVRASDDGRSAADPTKLQLLDRQGTVRWTIQLEPGAAKTLTYAYERYVPSS